MRLCDLVNPSAAPIVGAWIDVTGPCVHTVIDADASYADLANA